MQRFFSTFPDSWPGMGLLLLRVVAGGAAASQGGLYLASIPEPTAASWALGLLAVLSAFALIAGFLTPAAAAVVSVTTFLITLTWVPPIAASVVIDRSAALLVSVDGAALALLGPGAHSVDAYLFGRREIIIPHDSIPRSS
jgi:putative oxidoreductase